MFILTCTIKKHIIACMHVRLVTRLQDVVLRAWMLYLSKTDAAFSNIVPEREKVPSMYIRER